VKAPIAHRNHDIPTRKATNGMKMRGSSSQVHGRWPETMTWKTISTATEITV